MLSAFAPLYPQTCQQLVVGFSRVVLFCMFQLWDTLLAKVDEDLNNTDLKQTVKELMAEGFERKMNLVRVIIELF